MWDEFDEKFEEVGFVRGRDDRISAFDALAFVIYTECGALTGFKSKGTAGVHFDHPQVLGELLAFENAGNVVLLDDGFMFRQLQGFPLMPFGRESKTAYSYANATTGS